MKTKLTDILDCLSTLRDHLEEVHQNEIENAHGGDDPSTCSYCAAIHRADGILALNSDPDEHASLASVLHDAEQFVSGFEDDDAQEGIDGENGLLARLRGAVAFYGGEADEREGNLTDDRTACHHGELGYDDVAPSTSCLHGGDFHNWNDDDVCADCGARNGGLPDIAPPTVAQMRQALLNTIEAAKNTPEAVGADDAHINLENVGLDLCKAGGFDWEAVNLPSGEPLWQYCLKADPIECAEATLVAFDLWAGRNL